MPLRRSTFLLIALATLSLLAAAGCGGERRFSAEEFVAELGDAGAPLVLGAVITTDQEGNEVHTVEFAEQAPSATGAGVDRGAAHGGASGTLLALDDADLASAEFERCETAPALTCFRAANVVLRFEGLEGSDRARLVVALEALESGT